MPKQVDHAAQRQRIAEAALDAIGASGLDRVRLIDVARAADATTGTLTHYFDGKDALLAAALERVAERLIEGIASLEGEDLVDAASRALPLGATGRRDWRVWLSFWGRAIAQPELAAINNHAYARMHALLTEAVGAARKRGEVARELDPAEGADAIIAAVDGVGIRASLDPDAWPAARQRALLATLLRPILGTGDTASRPHPKSDQPDTRGRQAR